MVVLLKKKGVVGGDRVTAWKKGCMSLIRIVVDLSLGEIKG